MDIDTEAIRRLRDHLLERLDAADEEGGPAAGDGRPRSSGHREAVLRRVAPFAETMYLVMAADGDHAHIERRAVAAAISVLADGLLASQEIESLLERFAEHAARTGAEQRLAQIGSRLCGDPDDRETAFSLAAVVALADDHVHLDESHALQWIRTYYGVSDRRVAAILESIG